MRELIAKRKKRFADRTYAKMVQPVMRTRLTKLSLVTALKTGQEFFAIKVPVYKFLSNLFCTDIYITK